MQLTYLLKINKWLNDLSEGTNRFLIKHWWLPYILIAAINLLVRLWGLSDESIYGDDAFSIFYAQQPILNVHENLLFDRNPPLYFFLLHFWIKLFGLNVFFLKGLSVLFTTGTAILLWKISVKYFNQLTGFLVSVFFVFFNGWMEVSHELRSFALVGFLTVLSFKFYLDIIRQNRKSGLFGLAITNVLLLFSHYITFYIPVVQLIGSFFYIKTNVKGFRYFILSQLLALLLYLPWIKIVIENIPEKGKFWLITPGIEQLNSVFMNISGNPFIWKTHLIILGAFILLFLIDKKKIFIKKGFDIKLAFILLLWYLLPILINFLLAQYTPIFRYKYLIYTSLGLLLLISYIISILKIHPILKLILILALFHTPYRNFKPKFIIYENWKEIVPKVIKQKDDNTMVLICDWSKHREFAYYYNLEIFKDYINIIPELKKNHIHAIADSNSLKTVLYKWADKIIYVRSHDNVGDPKNTNVALLNKNNYRLCKKFGKDYLHVEIYLKDSIACDSLIPVQFFPGENCEMWKKSLVRSFYYDTLISYFNDMENDPDCELVRNRVSSPVYQGKYAAIVIDSLEYCSPLILPIHEIDTVYAIDISLMAFIENFNDARIVISIEGGNNPVFRTNYDLKKSVKNLNTWEKVSTTIKLPDKRGENTELRVYIWNPNPDPVYIDNVKLSFRNLPLEN